MTAEEFVREVNCSKIKPQEFEKIYEEFQGYQQKAIETLNEFHRVCELNGVSYQLAYGSLLGAIRDGGQIPWDYDIDVFVPYEERRKLIDALTRDLSSNFYFYCPETNSKCRHVMMRLAPNGFKSEVLHVDVFFLTGTPDDDEEKKQFCNEIKKVSQIRFYKLVKPFEEGKGHPKNIWKYIRGKLLYVGYSLKKAEETYVKLCEKYPAKKSAICVSADSFADWYEFPSNILWDTELIETRNGTFRIPKEYSKILKIEYGDYMSIPPIESRFHEMIVHYNRLKGFSREKRNEN